MEEVVSMNRLGVSKVLAFVCIIILLLTGFSIKKPQKYIETNHIKQISDYTEHTFVDQMDSVPFGSYPQSDISENNRDGVKYCNNSTTL